MPRAKQNKLYRTFTKGLITEAGYLTYPEDASVDELNTIISRKGNRTRRLGVDYEDGFVLKNISANPLKATNEFVWRAADQDSTNNFLVLQEANKIHFFGLELNPVSDSPKAYTIDLMTYAMPGATLAQVDTQTCQFSAGLGFLFIVHPFVEPISVTYKKATDTFTPIRVIIQIRDFEGVNDGLANDQEPATLTKEHNYNLQNQGWVEPGLGGATTTTTTTNPDGTTTTTTTTNDAHVYYDPYSGGFSQYEQIP